MGSALKIVGESNRLREYEQQLQLAVADSYEAFYRTATILEQIKDDKQAWQEAGYESFKAYAKDRQPSGFSYAHCQRLIAAKRVRELVPEVESPNGDSWTEGSLRPLTNSKLAPSDVRRLGKKIATRVRKGEHLSESLVRQMVEDDIGVTTKKIERVAETETAAEVLNGMRVTVEKWQLSLDKFPASFWDDAESEDRGCTKKLSVALSDLASYLLS